MKQINLPTLYSQMNVRWANELLGFNTEAKYNIYNYGCLISCLAMACEYYGIEENPSTINQNLKSVKGFVKDSGNYIWGSIEKLYPEIEETLVRTPSPLTDAQLKEIHDEIDAGHPVMLQIDYNPKTVSLDMHYVLCVGYNPQDENDLLIVDPLGGKLRSLKDYLGWFRPSVRKTIEQYIKLVGDVPQEGALQDKIIDFDDPEGKRKNVGWYVYEWGVEKKARIDCEQTSTKEIQANRDEIQELNRLLDQATKDIAKKEVVITEKNEKITELNETIVEKNNTIEILKNETLEKLTVGQVLVMLWETIKDLKFKK